jgi:outer membrane protein assembly factor BamB
LTTIIVLSVSSCRKTEEIPTGFEPEIDRKAETEGVGWPCWRGPKGDGISGETDWDPQTLVGGPKILWHLNIGMGYSNVVIRNNRLYTAGLVKGKEVIYCLDVETGEEIWGYSYPGATAPQATPAIDGASVYALSKEGVLICLNADDGGYRWMRDLVSEYGAVKPYYGFAGSPVIEGDLVVLTANASGLALEKETGEKRWISEKPPEKIDALWPDTTGTIYSTPVVYSFRGKRYAAIFGHRGLNAVDVKTGEVFWLYEWELFTGMQITDPIVIDNKIFISEFLYGSHRMNLYQMTGCVLLDISETQPRVLWRNQNLNSRLNTPVVIEGYIYGCHGGPNLRFAALRCLELESGDIMWEQKLVTDLYVSLSISITGAGDNLIILDNRSGLRVVKATPSSYEELAFCKIPSAGTAHQWLAPPVLYDGKMFCRNYAGDLVCIDVSK